MDNESLSSYFAPYVKMKSKSEKLFQFIEKSLVDIVHSDADFDDKSDSIYRLMAHFFVVSGEIEGLHFTTLFARIAYFATKLNFTNTLSRALHQFRIGAERVSESVNQKQTLTVNQVCMNGVYALSHAVAIASKKPVPESLLSEIPKEYPILLDTWNKDVVFIRHLRFIGTAHSENGDGYLNGVVDATGHRVKLNYADPGRSDLYQENVRNAIDTLGFPLMLNLIDVERDRNEVLSPRMIVLEPDYLVDVTAVAECFIDTGAESQLHLIKKFMPRVVNGPILLGAIANYFLDELIHDPNVTFKSLLPSVFKLNPIAISLLKDNELRDLIEKAELHFKNLQSVVISEFPRLGIDASKSFIEPSFYAPLFGLQGRLDLYHVRNSEESEIIELKSGRPFKPNVYGLNSTHYTQTLLYHLLISAASDFAVKPSSYILYSSQAKDALRYAPAVGSIQREAIRLRNEIYLIERTAFSESKYFEKLKPEFFPQAKGFLARDIERFSKTYDGLEAVERKYFLEFNKLISGDHFLAKVGTHGSGRRNGIASIWLNSTGIKNEQFSILSDLSVDFKLSFKKDGIVLLNKGVATNPLANFRKGDIAVLYPELGGERPSAISTQIYKCSITEIDTTTVYLRLRNKQVSYSDLKAHPVWTLEHDLLDSSFQSMHKSLFSFAGFKKEDRIKFLGLTPPDQPVTINISYGNKLSEHVKNVLHSMISASDYYLLWGPPGTGKTSVMLRHVVEYYLKETTQNILLLAYTNRAVDEMCQAIESIGGDIKEKYMRIGSRISTGTEYSGQLMSKRVEKIKSRKELVQMLQKQRIVVSTLSSIMGARDIFNLISLSTVIIDEASQILEPMLAGILPLFKKVILIGDHKQLPAVVMQNSEETRVQDPLLHKIHVYNTRTSYFERMYSLAVANGWNWAFGCLFEQGRMHEDIMQFVSKNFYGTSLDILSGAQSTRDLKEPLPVPDQILGTELSEAIKSHRMIYVPSEVEPDAPWLKTNNHEARNVVQIVREQQMMFPKWSIGIITPFRAQIANIRAHLQRAGIDPDDCTVDTVERYQGSARDVIILSVCANDSNQLKQVVSLSEEGVDRKLNVAITRAREQFIWTGAREILKENALYLRLIKACKSVSCELVSS